MSSAAPGEDPTALSTPTPQDKPEVTTSPSSPVHLTTEPRVSGPALSSADLASSGAVTTEAEPHHTATAAERAFQHALNTANLEEEVNQVMGTLNTWWGGLKKQSASALTTIKADLDKTVTQAQADIEHLRTAKIEIVRKEREPIATAADGLQGELKGKGKAIDPDRGVDLSATTSPTSQGLLDRLSSSTSQLQQSLQTTFQTTLASAANNPALANPSKLRAQLAENLQLSSARQNLQLSVKQAEKLAEEYLKKGDQWVKDAEKWMGDAVKVLPPDQSDTQFISTSWDGGDFYAFTTSSSELSNANRRDILFDGESQTPRPSSSSAAMAGSRKEALLRRLREDQDLLLVDPEGKEETQERRDEFRSWLRDQWEKTNETERPQEIGNVGRIRMALVPERISDEQFWQRYFFHKYMIEASEEKRKKLLEATQQLHPDDFSWDDEPEESPASGKPPRSLAEGSTRDTSPMPSAIPSIATGKTEAIVLNKMTPSTSTSPSRDSMDSYDLVSDQGGKPIKVVPAAAKEEEDDSDWE